MCRGCRRLRFMLMFVIGLFMGLVYENVSVFDYAGLSSLLAAVFLGVSIPSSICSTASLSTFFRQRSVYYRESSVKMYGYKTCTCTHAHVLQTCCCSFRARKTDFL